MLNKETARKLSALPVIDEISQLYNAILSYEPIQQEIKDKVFQKLKLDWNYNSNAIEGNQLNYGETIAFLMHGITAQGKTLKDHLDIKGHNDAINFLLSIIKEQRDITESDIRALHKMILQEESEVDAITSEGLPTKKRIQLGVYKTTPNSVKTKTGEMHYYPSVEETPILMDELMAWYNSSKLDNNIHPLVLAALFHHQFVAIHPFDDGNGRLARILMNLILMRNNYMPIVIKNEDKINYYGVLAQADVNQYIPLIDYFGKLLEHSLNIELKAIKGENIEEESDIDKEIELLKKSIDNNLIQKKGRTKNEIESSIHKSIMPLITHLNYSLRKLGELFYATTFNIFTKKYEFSKNEIELKEIPEFISVNTERNLYSFLYQFLLRRYKKIQTEERDLYRNIILSFEENHFSFKCMNITLTGYYNEPLTQLEINDFENAIMKDILNEIKQYTVEK